MRYLLDTCVLSEARHDSGDPGVRKALQTLAAENAYLASITVAEIVKGIGRLPASRRKTMLTGWYRGLLEAYGDRILGFDTPVAEETGRMAADAERRGTPIPLGDTMIGATAVRHDLVVMTRNVRHFQALGVPVFNPWTSGAP